MKEDTHTKYSDKTKTGTKTTEKGTPKGYYQQSYRSTSLSLTQREMILFVPKEIDADGGIYPGPSLKNKHGELDYVIESVFDMRILKHKGKQFFIKWEGYP